MQIWTYELRQEILDIHICSFQICICACANSSTNAHLNRHKWFCSDTLFRLNSGHFDSERVPCSLSPSVIPIHWCTSWCDVMTSHRIWKMWEYTRKNVNWRHTGFRESFVFYVTSLTLRVNFPMTGAIRNSGEVPVIAPGSWVLRIGTRTGTGIFILVLNE